MNKNYNKLAWTLVVIGMSIFAVERFGLSELGKSGALSLPEWLLSVLIIAPVLLVLAGCVVFMVGRMRRSR